MTLNPSSSIERNGQDRYDPCFFGDDIMTGNTRGQHCAVRRAVVTVSCHHHSGTLSPEGLWLCEVSTQREETSLGDGQGQKGRDAEFCSAPEHFPGEDSLMVSQLVSMGNANEKGGWTQNDSVTWQE